jgi:ABC-type amino acid transport substrate-binding protein
MKALLIAVLAALAIPVSALAAPRPSCAVPVHFLFSDTHLKRVLTAVAKDHRLTIAVVGTGSSALAGPDGPRSAYPARLEAILSQRLPGVTVKVIALLRSRLTGEDLAKGMDKLLVDEMPDLVVWQTGTIDAMRRIDPDTFKAALDDGVERLQKGGADVILMNMQYSPRTETMIGVGPYADTMRVEAQQRGVPLFDRLGIMKHWSDVGAFDLYAAGKDNVLAQRVHDCIGRAMSSLIIESGRLQPFERKAEQ